MGSGTDQELGDQSLDQFPEKSPYYNAARSKSHFGLKAQNELGCNGSDLKSDATTSHREPSPDKSQGLQSNKVSALLDPRDIQNDQVIDEEGTNAGCSPGPASVGCS